MSLSFLLVNIFFINNNKFNIKTYDEQDFEKYKCVLAILSQFAAQWNDNKSKKIWKMFPRIEVCDTVLHTD